MTENDFIKELIEDMNLTTLQKLHLKAYIKLEKLKAKATDKARRKLWEFLNEGNSSNI